MAATNKEVACLQTLVLKAGEQQETASPEFLKEPPGTGNSESDWQEGQQGRPFSSTQTALKAMEREAEQMGDQLGKLRAALMKSQGQQLEERGQQEREDSWWPRTGTATRVQNLLQSGWCTGHGKRKGGTKMERNEDQDEDKVERGGEGTGGEGTERTDRKELKLPG
ncbi:hypothetical protein STEG23_030816 [Scotinomys teguina]